MKEMRIVVRKSGTEQVVRIMVEYPDEAVAKTITEKIKKLVQEELR